MSNRWLITSVLVIVFFSQCNKAEGPSSQAVASSTVSKVTPDKLPGQCPFPCTDPRCIAYQFGYCGTPPPPRITVITNSNNPYDYAGSQHNSGVASIYSSVSASDPNLDNDVLAKDETYVAGLGYSSSTLANTYNTGVSDGLLPFSNIDELDSLGYTMANMGLIGAQANTYVQQIYNLTTTYLGPETVTSSMYGSYANSLISLESQISADQVITSSEKVALLSICSIGRYSAAYWINFKNGYTTAGASARFAVTPLSLKKWFHNLSFFWKVTLSDIGGGLVGVIGGPAGIIGGAVGTSIVSAIQLAN